jgi:hypothetical protein
MTEREFVVARGLDRRARVEASWLNDHPLDMTPDDWRDYDLYCAERRTGKVDPSDSWLRVQRA